MRIEGDHTFNAPRETVYTLLQDPDALAQAMPGATTLTRLSDDRYEAQVNVKVGAINGTYGGTVQVSDQRFPEHFVLLVEGRGAAGFLKGEGTVDLEEVDGGTVIHYAGETQVGGKIAQVGQRLIQSVARRMISQGLESLEKQLAAQHTEGVEEAGQDDADGM